MEEAEVREWLETALHVSRETVQRLEYFASLLLEEAEKQNLIARSTVEIFWDRHIRDSAQLLTLVPEEDISRNWLDIGSGPGLPGLVLAIIGGMPITLVEERKRRADFLDHAVSRLGLSGRVTVEGRKLQRVPTTVFDVITARAFAPLPKLFDLAHRFSAPQTHWLLLKGRTVDEELDVARTSWQGEFETVQSLTEPEASIISARNVRPGRQK